MIRAQNVTKYFDEIKAVDNVTTEMKSGAVFGLIGSNGAGKSTFLRMLAGILKPDIGFVTIDDETVFENPRVKSRFFYISDEQYFFPNATPDDMRDYYARIYPKFDRTRFESLLNGFELDRRRKINTFSKGMKKQLSVISGLSACTDYIFCDETFDGLDPVARQAVKSLFAADMSDRKLTPIIASHNLRELEDICDHVGLLHRGGILFSKDLDEIKLDIHKIQCVFTEEKARESFSDLQILSFERRGSLYLMTVRGEESEIVQRLSHRMPLFLEVLPLSLEEIFISETEVFGYDIKKLLV